MGRIKIGVCLTSLGLTFKPSLAAAQKMAVTGVELDAAGDFAPRKLSQTGRRELNHLLRAYNVELTALGCPMRRGLDVPENLETRIDYLREAMALAFDVGPRIIIVQPGKIPQDDKDPRMAWLTESLAALAKHGDHVGTTVALETGLDDAPALETFLARFDTGSLAVNYNPGNLFMSAFNPYQAGRSLGRRIVHAHAKDARSTIAGRSAQEVPLGHGDLDWMELLGALAEIDFSGWLNVERAGGANPVAEVSAGVQFLRRLIV